MATVRIAGVKSRAALKDVERAVGTSRLYSKGTDPDVYADFMERLEASMAVINLNTIHGVKASILGD